MKFLVVGCGSIGQRHIKNLKELGFNEIIGCDLDNNILTKIKEEHNVETDSDYKNLLKKADAVFVCTPNSFHIQICLDAAKAGKHLFIEKPISHSLEGVDELLEIIKEKNLVSLVGFNLRFHPQLKKIKKLLEENRIGKVISVRSEFGHYLPDWHPKSDYTKEYSANRFLGGGVILDAHEFDYVTWMIGFPNELFCTAGRYSNLKIDTEDTAEVILKYPDFIVNIHIDYIQKNFNRSLEIIGENGVIKWNFQKNKIEIITDEKRVEKLDNFDVNQTYIDELKHFINCIKGKEKSIITAEQADRVLKLQLAAKESAANNKVVKL